MMLHRRFLHAIVVLVLSLVPAAAQSPPDRVRVALFASVADAGLYSALEKGYFREQNLAVEFVQLDAASVVNTALASGDVDVAGASLGAGLYNAIRQGLPLKLVADKGKAMPGHGYLALVVRKELASEIKSLADLRGRNVAVTSYNSGGSNEVFVSHMLEQAGLKPDDMNLINISFGDIVSALASGRADVGFLVEPLVSSVVEKGIAVVLKRVDEIYPNQQYTAIVYGPGIIRRPDVAKRFMIANLKGVRFYNDALAGKASRDELISILVKYTSVKNPGSYAKMVFPGLDPNGAITVSNLKDDIARLLASGSMKAPVDPSTAIDASYANYAVEKLGPAK